MPDLVKCTFSTHTCHQGGVHIFMLGTLYTLHTLFTLFTMIKKRKQTFVIHKEHHQVHAMRSPQHENRKK